MGSEGSESRDWPLNRFNRVCETILEMIDSMLRCAQYWSYFTLLSALMQWKRVVKSRDSDRVSLHIVTNTAPDPTRPGLRTTGPPIAADSIALNLLCTGLKSFIGLTKQLTTAAQRPSRSQPVRSQDPTWMAMIASFFWSSPLFWWITLRTTRCSGFSLTPK